MLQLDSHVQGLKGEVLDLAVQAEGELEAASEGQESPQQSKSGGFAMTG